jgi:hypothetical protein
VRKSRQRGKEILENGEIGGSMHCLDLQRGLLCFADAVDDPAVVGRSVRFRRSRLRRERKPSKKLGGKRGRWQRPRASMAVFKAKKAIVSLPRRRRVFTSGKADEVDTRA